MNKVFQIILVLWAVQLSALADAAQTNEAARQRISIAIIPPANSSGDPALEFWSEFIGSFFSSQLGEIRSSFRAAPYSSIEFGLKSAGLKKGQMLQMSDAQRVGRAIEARYVIWSDYTRSSNHWRLNAEVVNTATGKTPGKWSVTSTNWQLVLSGMVTNVAHFLDVTIIPEETKRIEQPWTTSAEALEHAARAADAMNRRDAPVASIENDVVSTTALDPKCPSWWRLRASFSAMAGRTDDATEQVQRAIALDREDGESFFLLGAILSLQEKYDEARVQLLKAVELDPEHEKAYEVLAEVSNNDGLPRQAKSYLETARELAPYNATIRAELGRAYAKLGSVQRATAELKMAEKIGSLGPDEILLGDAYYELNAIPEAFEHYQNGLAIYEKRGFQGRNVEIAKERLAELKPRLTPHFITAIQPKSYSTEAVNDAIKQAWPSGSKDAIESPFVCTPEMKAWAKELVGDAKGDLERAEKLYTGLTRRGHFGKEKGLRDAIQTFRAWPDSNARLTCQEFTFLYTALARAADLKSCFVLVRKDCDTNFVLHACSCVFLDGGKAVLVDPNFLWFGVPHQDYQLLDDMQATGLFLAQEKKDPGKLDAGVKLASNIPEAQLDAAISYSDLGQKEKARQALEVGLKLEPNSWLALYVQAAFAQAGDKTNEAIKLLEQSLTINPNFPQGHCLLGFAYKDAGNLTKAYEEFKAALQGDLPQKLVDEANDEIAKINERR